MPVTADYHLHSSFSGDSDTKMEIMIQTAIEKGLSQICFTEHMDIGYPYRPDDTPDMFEVNTDAYLYELLCNKERYKNRIKICFGIELGLQLSVVKENLAYARSHEFDFIIASLHVCNGKDPYYPDFYQGRPESSAYREYFTDLLKNIQRFSNFDVVGHLDYIVRYGPNKDAFYSYEAYQDCIDPILMYLIENEKGLELNTAGLSKGLKDVHPHTSILKRYRELGGEIITIGSDAHEAKQLGSHFSYAAQILSDCGFRYYSVFENRIPEYRKI